jgi:hypothetical protein
MKIRSKDVKPKDANSKEVKPQVDYSKIVKFKKADSLNQELQAHMSMSMKIKLGDFNV